MSPIDAYLDDLARALVLDAPTCRRILAECKDHLRATAERHIASGLDRAAAETRAVTDFGSPRAVTRRFAAAHGRLLPLSTALQLAIAAWLLAAVGFAAIGASGVLAAGFGRAFGKAFVAGDPPGVTYSQARCADFARLHPEQPGCAQAAIAHHYDEVVGYRFDAGVLGILLLASYVALRRRYRHAAGARLLPASLTPAAGSALFGAAGVALCGLAALQLASGWSSGVGAALASGLVALVASTGFASALVRALGTIERTA